MSRWLAATLHWARTNPVAPPVTRPYPPNMSDSKWFVLYKIPEVTGPMIHKQGPWHWNQAVAEMQDICGYMGVEFEGYEEFISDPLDNSDIPIAADPEEEDKLGCNRHINCDAANEQARQQGKNLPYHCRNEDCEDCFGC